MKMYTRPNTYVGGECDIKEWTLSATGDGTALGMSEKSPVQFQAPVTLAAGTTIGVAMVSEGAGQRHTNGNGVNEIYSNNELTFRAGVGALAPFNCSVFSPRVWNGTIFYESDNYCPCPCDIDTTTGVGVCDIFDFLAFQNGFVRGCP